MKFCPKLLFVVLVSFLSACSGGGGGSSDGENDRFGIRVMHAALQGTPLEFVDPEDLEKITQVSFLGESFYASAPIGEIEVPIFTANSGATDLVSSPGIEVLDATRYSILIYDDVDTFGVKHTVFTDSVPEIERDTALVRFVHAVTKVGSLSISIIGGSESPEVAFSDASSYQVAPVGSVSFVVTSGDDASVLFSGSFELESGKAYSLLLAGEEGIFVSARLYRDL